MNFGRPAPEPINTASNPSSLRSSSIVTVLPTITFVSILTPNALTFSISGLTTSSFGNLNSGIPYTKTPPGSCKASNIVTSYPSLAKSPAQVSPAGPEPTTATLLPFILSALVGFTPCSLAQSAVNLSSLPIEIGAPLIPLIHFCSH